MNLIKYIAILTFVVSGFLFARSGVENSRDIRNIEKVNKAKYYWMQGHIDNDSAQIDRKRSNKRRRQIRKPIRGLR